MFLGAVAKISAKRTVMIKRRLDIRVSLLFISNLRLLVRSAKVSTASFIAGSTVRAAMSLLKSAGFEKR